MGPSTSRSVALLFVGALGAQEPAGTAPLRPVPGSHEQVVLAGGEPIRLAEFGLGDGGIRLFATDALRWQPDGCVTGGGVQITCRAAGVKLTFPSGRELLVAPDGFVHLRSEEKAGPFAGGIELHLGDGARVRILLVPGARDHHRLRDVLVLQGERALQPWRRGEPANEIPRVAPWAGVRIACCGDGGDLYRAIALGPLIVLDRVLVAADRAEQAPAERLVVSTAPLLQSLLVMQRQHRVPDAAVRRAIATVAAVADRGDVIFPAGASLQRAERRQLRWLLRAGFELQLDLVGPLGPRLQLFAGEARHSLVEWTLRADGAAFLTNPHDDQIGAHWHGNGTRLPRLAPDLQAKDELFERGLALKVIERLER